jgi:diacylglycerol kinase (ATP)
MQVLKMLRSFRHAIRGLKFLLEENNFKFHLLASVIVLLAGFYVKLSNTEWVIIVTQIGLVSAAETFNTAIEKLCDFVSPEHQPLIGKVKDLAAAAVLIVSVVAVIVGIIIFLPKVLVLDLSFTHSNIHSFTH